MVFIYFDKSAREIVVFFINSKIANIYSGMKPDELYMFRCIEIASQALGNTAPNPLVGAIIVCENKIIAEGVHRVFGGLHAEADAIGKVPSRSLLKKSTLYVNLEPCSHQGKTPPCAELIVKSGIPRVVTGNPDPNSLVSGKGIRLLRKNGIEVKTGICEDSCIELNKRFFTFHVLKRPYIILKWAQTIDGFIDVIRTPDEQAGINWISNETSRLLVHKWRSEEQAIIIGTNTARMDNPILNTRYWNGKNPLRMVTDRNLTLSQNLNVFDKSLPTIILNSHKSEKTDNLEFLKINFTEGFPGDIMNLLFERGVQSLIVEGGKMLIESFILQNLWDEARVFTGQKKFVNGIPAPVLDQSPVEISSIQSDQLFIYRNYDPFRNQVKNAIHAIGAK